MRELDGYFNSPEDRPPTRLAMMRAYIDESGHETKAWVVVAGFFGTEDAWKEFVPAWQKGLGPQRKTLHMSSLRWKKDSTRRLLKRLGPIPSSCGLLPCVGGVRVSDYEDLLVDDELIVRLKGYEAALTPMVINVLRGVPKNERIEFVFEEQHEYAPAVANVMVFASVPDYSYKITGDGLPKIAKWGFVPKGSTIMIDPSDYLAYATREHCMDRNSRKAQWSRPILEASREAYGRIMTRDEVRRRVTTSRNLLKRYYGL